MSEGPKVISWVLTARDQTAATFAGFNRRLESIGLTGDSVSKKQVAMGAGMLTAGVMIGKGIEGAVKKAEEFENSFAAMNRMIGATGKEAEAWDSSFRKVYSNAPAATLDSVSKALGFLGQNMKGTHAEIEGMATVSFKLARINKEEVQPIVEAMGRTFNNWGISASEAATKADFLARISQTTGAKVTTLLEGVDKSAAVFKTAGISFELGTYLLGKFSQAGIDTSKATMGLQKAMTTLAKDSDKTNKAHADAVKALSALQTKFSLARQEAAKHGKQFQMTTQDTYALSQAQKAVAATAGEAGKAQASLGERVRALFDSIKNAKTDTDALSIATAAFGARSAVTFMDAIRSGKLSLDDLTKTLGDTKGALDSTLGGNNTIEGKMASMRRQIDLVKESIGKGFLPILLAIVTPLAKFAKAMADTMEKHPMIAKMVAVFAALAAVLLTLGGAAIILNQMRIAIEGLKVIAAVSRMLNLAFVGAPWILAIIALAAIVYLVIRNWTTLKRWFEVFWQAFQRGWDSLTAGVTRVWHDIYGAVSGAVSGIINFVRTNWRLIISIILGPLGIVIALVTKYWSDITGAITGAISGVLNFISSHWRLIIALVLGPIGIVIDVITYNWNAIVRIVTGAVNATLNVVQSVWGAIAGFVSGVWNAVFGVVQSVWNGIVGFIENVVGRVRDIVVGGVNAIRGPFEAAWNGLKDAVTGVWDAITGAVGGAIGRIKQWIDEVIGTIERVIGRIGDLINKIPGAGLVKGLANAVGLAKGGPTTGGRTYLVGEKGPELWMERSPGTMVSTEKLASMLAGSFKGGGNVDKDMIGKLHAKEMVLPAGLADTIRGLAGGHHRGPLVGGDMVVHYPKPETAGETLQRQAQKLAYLGMVG